MDFLRTAQFYRPGPQIATKSRVQFDAFRVMALSAPFCLLAAACTPTHVASQPLSPQTLSDLRSDVEGRRVTVKFLPLVRTKLGWSNTETGIAHLGEGAVTVDAGYQSLLIPLHQVEQIKVKDRGAGLGRGVLVGALLGLAGVALVGRANPFHCRQGVSWAGCSGVGYFLGAVLGGGLGAATGALTGALLGAGPSWDFHPTPGR